MSQKSTAARRFNIRNVANAISTNTERIIQFIAELNKRGKFHGIDHFVNKKYHPIERFLWLCLVIAAFYGCYYVGNSQMERFAASPTVISIERDYRLWNGTIPALTVCYHNRIDEAKAQFLVKRSWNITEKDEDFAYLTEYVKTVAYASISSFEGFHQFADDKRLESVDMFQIARNVHPTVKSTVSSFDPTFNPAVVQVMTERGICYVVNSIMSASLQATKTLGAYKSSITDSPKTCSYRANQCFMRFEVFDPTIQYFVHSPYEIITQNSLFIDVGPTDEIENTYDIVETLASPNLRALGIEQRKCLFYDESLYEFSGYNVNVCRAKCQAEAAIKLCQCRPHFYSFVNGTSCSPSGLVCLSINSWPNDVKCKCPKTCSELVYTQNIMKKTNWAADGELTVLNKKSSVRYEILSQKIRFRRDILFSFEDLIVSFGGIASLFLGYNFLGTIQLLYYILNITIRSIYRKFFPQ